MNKLAVTFAVAAMTFVASQSFAVSPQIGNMCVSCHGANGIASNPNFPDIGGQKKNYLKEQLLAYKAGTRKDPKGAMNNFTAGLSEKDIDDLAVYFSAAAVCK
jgi:cytochrome c553